MKTDKVYSRSLYSNTFFPYSEHRRRQYGMKAKLGTENQWKCHLYQSMQPFSSWEPNGVPSIPGRVPPHRLLRPNQPDNDAYSANVIPDPGNYGGVFNLEFSPDGKVLAAACQNKAVVLFDPLMHQQTKAIIAAHTDCVTGIKFLDERLFASCSDDHTVAVWDVRNLQHRVFSLTQHTKWVKNIEYHPRDGMLLTSGFDNTVIAWDINRPCSEGSSVHHEQLCLLPDLMRMKLSPDLSKLVLCTRTGYMLVLQNVDLSTMQKDVKGIKHLGRGGKSERAVIGRHRNRPVVIVDFPPTNTAQSIHSIQIHPQSWAVLSRNTSVRSESEWTCVHDIQEFPLIEDDSEQDLVSDESQQQPCNSKIGQGGPGRQGEDVVSSPPEDESIGNRGDGIGSPPSNRDGYYIVGDAATPRFEMLLDHRGGNWVDLAAARQRLRGRRNGVGANAADNNNDEDMEEEEEEEDEEGEDGDDEDNEENNMFRRRGGRRMGGGAVGSYDNDSDDNDDVDVEEDMAMENHRQRAIILGLDILIQRNAASVYSELRALGIGPEAEQQRAPDGEDVRERRRGGRGRALPPQQQNVNHTSPLHLGVSPRDRIERHNLLHSYRSRMNHRLSQLTQRVRERRLGRAAAAAAGEQQRNAESEEERQGGDEERRRVIAAGAGVRDGGGARVDGPSSWNERNNEIRRTLRSLRSGLDLVMANLNSVRRQLDNDVGLLLDMDPEPFVGSHRSFYGIGGIGGVGLSGIRNSPRFCQKYLAKDLDTRKLYFQQRPRLTHYILEPNVGVNFIKELCFSTDGRLICSPYKYGVRLLMFDQHCSEMSHCITGGGHGGAGKPQQLTEVVNIANCHSKSVVSTKFSPTHTLLVSGCLDGKITWHQPVL